MKRILIALFLLILAVPHPAAAQDEPGIVIISPRDGDVLQGVAPIIGVSAVEGFASAEISFAYADDPTQTWFLIQANDHPTKGDVLTTWDTSTLTDGVYVLRLQVVLQDGKRLDVTVTGLRVRNYTPAETPTPAPTKAAESTATFEPATATPAPYLSPTPLPPNDASITTQEITSSLANGALTILTIFAFFGLILRLRRD